MGSFCDYSTLAQLTGFGDFDKAMLPPGYTYGSQDNAILTSDFIPIRLDRSVHGFRGSNGRLPPEPLWWFPGTLSSWHIQLDTPPPARE